MATAQQLEALARKYETLLELQRTQHAVSAEQVRQPLRDVSQEFPGALREVDLLGPQELEQRRRSLSQAAGAEALQEPWMDWMWAYHALMRACLVVKRQLAGRKDLTERERASIAATSSAECGELVDADLVSMVARPPRGRLNDAVFTALGQRFGQTPDTLREALFPTRRRHDEGCDATGALEGER